MWMAAISLDDLRQVETPSAVYVVEVTYRARAIHRDLRHDTARELGRRGRLTTTSIRIDFISLSPAKRVGFRKVQIYGSRASSSRSGKRDLACLHGWTRAPAAIVCLGLECGSFEPGDAQDCKNLLDDAEGTTFYSSRDRRGDPTYERDFY
jgi:hypothetical protein